MQTSRRSPLALLLLLPLLAAPTADAAPKPRVEILSNSREALASTGALTLRVSAPKGSKVRLASPIVTKGKVVSIKRGSRTRVTLTLSGAGRIAAGACAPLRLELTANVRTKGRTRKLTTVKDFPIAKRCGLPRSTSPGGPGGGGETAPGAEAPGSTPGSGGNGGGGEPAPASKVRAGAARADITAPVGTPMFAYTARNKGFRAPDAGAESLEEQSPEPLIQVFADPDKNLYSKGFEPSRGIHTRVFARAIVLESGGKKFALVMTDLGGLPSALTAEVVKRIEATGISQDRLMLSATHTHSSTGPIWPMDNAGYALLGGDLFDTRVFDLTAQGIAESIIEANKHLEPARVGVGDVDVRNASRNRAQEAFVLNPEHAQGAESIDPDLNVVRVDATDGRPIGVWSNFAIHPTSFGDENANFSGDNAASAERHAESAIAADAAKRGVAVPADKPVVNVWTNSNEGDISPDGGPRRLDGQELDYVTSSEASANIAGVKVGEGIVDAWREAGQKMEGDLAIDARSTFVTFDGRTIDGKQTAAFPVLGAGEVSPLPDPKDVELEYEGNRAPEELQPPEQTHGAGQCSPDGVELAGPGQGKKFPAVGAPGLVPQSQPVSFWRIGDFGIAAFPAEITKTMGARIRERVVQASGGKVREVALSGLTNGYVSYTATPEEYDHCHYESSFTLFGTHEGLMWTEGARGLAEDLFAGRDSDAGIAPPAIGLGTPNPANPISTPDAGSAGQQPEASYKRFQRATFSWKGGDSSVDAARGKTFVALQRQTGAGWDTVGTEEGVNDITTYDDDTSTWTETWQFGACDPLGTYRFEVTGASSDGPYKLTSRPFELRPTDPLTAGAPSTEAGEVRVTSTYPSPGDGALIALPRVLRTGETIVSIRKQNGSTDRVRARPSAEHPWHSAKLPAGATVTGVASVEDGCGNASSQSG